MSPENESLSFSPADTLRLEPQEIASITALVTPANGRSVSFEVLTDDVLFDGFLFEEATPVQDDGRAIVELQAPSRPSTFIVRARSGELETYRAVSVSAHGYGSLVVKPDYNGTRQIRRWTTSARAGVSCDDLDSYWIDGPLVGSGIEFAQIENVPSGVPIALTLRGDEVVSGCTTLSAVGADTNETIYVKVTDRPLRWDGVSLDLTLGMSSTSSAFSLHLDEAVKQGVINWRGEASSDAEALVQAMEKLIPADSTEEFSELASSVGYPELLAESWQDASSLSSTFSTLLTQAAQQIPSSQSIQGHVLFEAQEARLTLTAVAGAQPDVAGFEVTSFWTVDTESNSALALGGRLVYRPLSWLAAIAELATYSPVEQLNEAARCDLAAEKWTSANGGFLYQQCDVACAEKHCLDALENSWHMAGEGGASISLEVGITGPAEVSGDAYISGLQGSWIGRFEGGETSVKGDASLTASAD